MNPDNLLILSRIFELNVGKNYDDNHYVLKCLASFEDPSFKELLSELLEKEIDEQDFEKWVKKNNVKDLLANKWMFVSNPNRLFTYKNYGMLIISKVQIKDFTENLKEKKSSFIGGEGSIPNLYLYELESDLEPLVPSKIPAELAQDAFIVIALSKIFGFPMNGAHFDNCVDFIVDNINKINEIRSFFKGPPLFVGGGSDGVVFSIGKGYVLKIFYSDHAYNEAKKAMERLHSSPEIAKTEAMIYDVGTIGTFEDKDIYYYIMEEMRPVESFKNDKMEAQIEKIIGHMFLNMFGNYKDALKKLKVSINDKSNLSNIQKSVKELSSKISGDAESDLKEQIDDVAELLSLKGDWLNALAEELIMKYLTSRTDLHLGNLGATNYGKLRYFDPAFQLWTSRVNFNFENKTELKDSKTLNNNSENFI